MAFVTSAAISAPRRAAALGTLTLLYFFNFVDRQIIAILVEPIKADLGLADWQLGVVSGVAFAALYATLGIPIARLADRAHRVNIISVAVALWSAMTAVCGLAQNFVHLVLARVGVGVGEAGLTPPAHSLIADMYPERQRATALAIYQLGVPTGALFGLLAGGLIAEAWGWRVAFIAVGLPGVLLALVAKWVIPEPRTTGGLMPTAAEQPPFIESLALLWRIHTFRQLVLGFALVSFVTFGYNAWLPALLGRMHGLSTADIALWLGPVGFVSGVAGTFLGGLACDRLGQREPRWYAWLLAIGFAVSIPFLGAVFLAPSATLAIAAYVVPNFLIGMNMGPTFAMAQFVAPEGLRAMASSILLFFANMIGLGLGPLTVGALSDALAPSAGAGSLRLALLVVLPVLAWCALHYLLAGRTLRAEIRATETGETSA
ncbi:MAG: MFS transporter [Gammaproteobacteria bacterium]|nr:MFS transporter [Gammaproteobacteria bacterium]